MTWIEAMAATASANKDSFEESKFMKDLVHLRDTQEAIQSLSGWCLKNKKSSYKIARCWLKVVKKVKNDQKLALFYLLNDIVQHAKRKNHNELIERFQSVLKEAMPHLKDENIANKVRRCLNIWSERQVFNEKFLKELIAILETGKKKDINDIVDTFQPHQLCTQIKIMKALEDDTEYKLKTLSESDINLVDFDEVALRQNLKDRQHGNDYINEVEESRKRLEQYIKAVDREITKRRQVKDLLEQAKKYYDSLYDEAAIVTNAYTSFGKKVKNVEKKLEAKMPDMDQAKSVASLLSDADLSPIPSPDYDAPSPEPDDQETELRLPDEHVDKTSNAVPPSPAIVTTKGTAEFGGERMSISEYLTKLAGQDQPASSQNNGHYYYDESGFYQDQPPAATAWPAPKPDYQPQEWSEEPVPEWQIEPEDEEPPDASVIIEENLAMARLQSRTQENTLVQVNTDASARNDVDMEVVNSEDEDHPQELSLQERLSNLAGVPLPPHPPPLMQQQAPMLHQQPPPRPFFAERPPHPPRGRGHHRPSPHFRGGFGSRRPFRGGRRGQRW